MDVVDLREFYATALGLAARRLIAERIRGRWSSLSGAAVLGLGYAVPYLDLWREEASRIVGFMPARQGVVHWPGDDGPSATALVDEADLPLSDSSVDFVLAVHALELTEELPALLREVFRVLSPQGRALFIVPNRRGMWARFDSTPFGHGRPFSRIQLTQMLREAQFSPVGWSGCLFMPPLGGGFFTRSAPAVERAASWISPAFPGLIMVEAMKQVYAVQPGKRARRLVAGFRPVLQPAGALNRGRG